MDRTLAEARPTRPEQPFRRDAPNVVVIVLDDLGFAQLGCYGSDLETPHLDALAERGVRFTNFHTTAICSPTRACLLTGRNHHRVGMGMLPDLPLGFPGYRGQFPEGAGTLAQVLRHEGYATYAIGKWHLVPRDQRAAGPFHMWPTGLGFERYYGFLNGETNQWTPNLVRDQHHVEPPRTPEEGYHLEADLVDEAIGHLRDLRLASPDRPFLLWYASGAPHAPHQAPPEYLARMRGRFDAGWDEWRRAALERQQALGVVGPEVELSARPSWVEPWDEIEPERRRLYARMMEAFAAFVAHADDQIGRLLAAIEAMGELDDTVVVLVSDNGCSAEGGPNGSWNQLRHYLNDQPDDLDEEYRHLDDLGGFRSSGHYPWGWALAGNTPFQRWKRYTYEGGVRDPFIVSWPNGLGDQAGTLRHQYAHATDLLPTLLDLLGITVPETLGGVPQMDLDGVSQRPVLEDASTPDQHVTQYFECWGSRAIYHDGWKAVTDHVNQLTAAERDAMEGSADFGEDRWALYDTRSDPAERHDLAAAHPERLAELVALWEREAERNGVLPLDDSRDNRIPHLALPWVTFRDRYDLRPGDKVHESHAPVLFGGYTVTARFADGLAERAEGTLVEQGDWISGWALVLLEGDLVLLQQVDGRIEATRGAVPAGARVLRALVTPDGTGAFDVTLEADGEVVGRGRLSQIPLSWAPDGAFLTVGWSRPFPVTDAYAPPFPAPDELDSVTITTGPPPPFDLAAELAHLLRHQ